ncbi:polysaccharide biosynthesis C-terminal domain-containing protein, partial [Acinetobacter baumannii]|nr:polysaccharide biosynthesis C-terminal domain-containing protein [Acinetobacter baumannii]
PAVMLLNFGSSVLRAFGNSKTPLYSVAISACLNVVLDLLFVKVFGFGVQGAAWATVIAQFCAGLFCIF